MSSAGMDDSAIRDQGIELTPARLESAAQTYEALLPRIETLRQVHLSYLEPVWEPASALRWIESGGEEEERWTSRS